MNINELSERFDATYLDQFIKVGTDIEVEGGFLEFSGELKEYDNYFVYLGVNAISWERVIMIELVDMDSDEFRELLNMPTSEKVS